VFIDIADENEWDKRNKFILFNKEVATGKWVVMYDEMHKNDMKTYNRIVQTFISNSLKHCVINDMQSAQK
jgi:hypothetical protein